MKIVTVVGARPQFIKAAAVSRVIRPRIQEVLIHTGQHYDENMSDIFFSQLRVPAPDYHLHVGSKSHARQTGEMMIGIEDVLVKEKPDGVLLYGDTNSTLAGALAAGKLHIPILHVEAGLRSYNMEMPEELNRILTDRISALLFCPTETACANLRREGITEGVHCVGDVMCDAVRYYLRDMEIKDSAASVVLTGLDGSRAQLPESWYLATIHRAENTGRPEKLGYIMEALRQLERKVIFPVHPRIRKMAETMSRDQAYEKVLFVEPLGYLEMLYMTGHAAKVITDSGGLQKECYIMKTPCITVRDQTEWVETLEGGCNRLVKAEAGEIVKAVLAASPHPSQYKDYYGDGQAASRILKVMLEFHK